MGDVFENFQKKQEYLICIDSDGCAMDTMDIKHFKCFGPCMVKEWGLEPWKEALLKRWNEVNLYSMTRGINRFKALAIVLREAGSSMGSMRLSDGVRRRRSCRARPCQRWRRTNPVCVFRRPCPGQRR